MVAQKTQLPLAAIKAEHRFLGDLHLNSITISQIILETAGRLKIPAVAQTEFTNATLAKLPGHSNSIVRPRLLNQPINILPTLTRGSGWVSACGNRCASTRSTGK
jgi:hypothetical protein